MADDRDPTREPRMRAGLLLDDVDGSHGNVTVSTPLIESVTSVVAFAATASGVSSRPSGPRRTPRSPALPTKVLTTPAGVIRRSERIGGVA